VGLVLLVVLPKHRFELLFLLAVFIDLSFELTHECLDLFLQFFDLWLLEVKELALIGLRLELVNFVGLHLENTLSQLLQGRLRQGHLLAAVTLLLLELDRLLLARLLLLRTCNAGALEGRAGDHASHALLLWHRGASRELVMNSLDDGTEAGVGGVPAADRRPNILNCDGVERGVRD